MTSVETAVESPETVADLLERLGDIPPARILLRPRPGDAKEEHLLGPGGKLCELIDGVLVRKAMGFRESLLAAFLIRYLDDFARARNLGIVAGPDATLRLMPGLVRLPDVCFCSWDRLPGRRVPAEAVPDLAPDLAVEVLSEGNTPKEMARKRREFFEAGTRLVWEVDPAGRAVTVYRGPEVCRTLREHETIDGEDVLPGFALPLRALFAELDRQG